MKNRNKVIIGTAIAAVGGALLYSKFRSNIPDGAEPLRGFDIHRYLGTWYEIARLNYRFEKNIDNAIAQYRLNNDKTVHVRNSGYDLKKKQWTEATGTAKFRNEEKTGALKVSFFGPFYAGYNVIAIDGDYKYALVAGRNLNYLWILSRTPAIPEQIKSKYLAIAESIGYDTAQLIWVKHDKENPYAG